MSEDFSEMVIEDLRPFQLVCYNSQVPLYSPYYFHMHQMICFNQDTLETMIKYLQDEMNKNGQCGVGGEECQLNSDNPEFLKPKKQRIIEELLDKRVINVSHKEYIQINDNHSVQTLDVKNFYKNKIYLPFKNGEDYEVMAGKQSSPNQFSGRQNLQIQKKTAQKIIWETKQEKIEEMNKSMNFLQSESDATNFYWNTIYELIVNDIYFDEDAHFNLQTAYQDNNYFYNLCLLTGNIVLIPVRLSECQHLECFDFNSIFEFIQQYKTDLIQCPICSNQAQFFSQLNEFYLDKKLLKLINKNTSYQPVWKFLSHDKGLQDILRCEQMLDISSLNKIFWKSKNDEQYQNLLNQLYLKQEGSTINKEDNVPSIYPIPVRCIKCKDISKYCDLAQQLLQQNKQKCLCCSEKIESAPDQIRIDFLLLEQIQKYAQFQIQTFQVEKDNYEQIILNVPLQNLQDKISRESKYKKNLVVVKKDMMTNNQIVGLPIRWKGCNHLECLDLNNFRKNMPRYCVKCKKTYKVTDCVWDEILYESIYCQGSTQYQELEISYSQQFQTQYYYQNLPKAQAQNQQNFQNPNNFNAPRNDKVIYNNFMEPLNNNPIHNNFNQNIPPQQPVYSPQNQQYPVQDQYTNNQMQQNQPPMLFNQYLQQNQYYQQMNNPQNQFQIYQNPYQNMQYQNQQQYMQQGQPFNHNGAMQQMQQPQVYPIFQQQKQLQQPQQEQRLPPQQQYQQFQQQFQQPPQQNYLEVTSLSTTKSEVSGALFQPSNNQSTIQNNTLSQNQIPQHIQIQREQPLEIQREQPLEIQREQPIEIQREQPIEIQREQPHVNQTSNPFIPSYYNYDGQFIPFSQSKIQVIQREINVIRQPNNQNFQNQQPRSSQFQQQQYQPQQQQPNQVPSQYAQQDNQPRTIVRNGKSITFKPIKK